MDILEEIKKEHGEFKEILSSIENSKNNNEKKQLFEKLYANLIGHHEAEEHVLYKDVKEKSDDEGKDIVREMIEEHSLAAYQLSVVQKTSLSNETWDAKFSVLKELIEHHIEEEEKTFFKQTKKVIDKEILIEKYDAFETTMEEYRDKQEKKLKG